MRRPVFTLAAGLAALAFSTAVQAADFGTLTGQVVLDGKMLDLKPVVAKGDSSVRDAEVCSKEEIPDESLVVDPSTKGIANCFIYLRKTPKTIAPGLKNATPAKLTFDNQKCRFSPHVLALQSGQPVQTLNSDSVAHNLHTWSLKNPQLNFLLQPNNTAGVPVSEKEQETVPFKVTCDIHPWMQGYWLVCDHPYFAVTDKDGKFEIKDLPVGENEFRVWQERAGYVEKSLKVTIKAGANELKPIKASASIFNK